MKLEKDRAEFVAEYRLPCRSAGTTSEIVWDAAVKTGVDPCAAAEALIEINARTGQEIGLFDRGAVALLLMTHQLDRLYNMLGPIALEDIGASSFLRFIDEIVSVSKRQDTEKSP